jgi:hypothetical protein
MAMQVIRTILALSQAPWSALAQHIASVASDRTSKCGCVPRAFDSVTRPSRDASEVLSFPFETPISGNDRCGNGANTGQYAITAEQYVVTRVGEGQRCRCARHNGPLGLAIRCACAALARTHKHVYTS